MSSEIPNFARLLAPFITAIPDASRPGFLALLERGAAERYRAWAEECDPADREGLLACAAREDEIADRVEQILPAAEADRPKLRAELPRARDAYFAVFEELPLGEKLRLQAGAERQGAAAWRMIASQQEDSARREALERCAALEEESAAHLETLLGEPVRATRRDSEVLREQR